MRLSFGWEQGLGGHVVQNASESHRIRPNPAKTVKPRRFLDHPRAEPFENSETQTHFGPLPPTATRSRSAARRSLGAESAAGRPSPPRDDLETATWPSAWLSAPHTRLQNPNPTPVRNSGKTQPAHAARRTPKKAQRRGRVGARAVRARCAGPARGSAGEAVVPQAGLEPATGGL